MEEERTNERMNEKEGGYSYDCLFCGRARKLVTSAFVTLKFMMRVVGSIVETTSTTTCGGKRTSKTTRRIKQEQHLYALVQTRAMRTNVQTPTLLPARIVSRSDDRRLNSLFVWIK